MKIKVKRSSEDKIRRDFLPEALEIIEKPSAPLGHVIIFLIILLVIIALVWAIVGKVDEAAMARGKVVTVDGIQKVQTAKTGVVTDIRVKEGDYVKTGEVLYVLDCETEKTQHNSALMDEKVLELKITMLKDAVAKKDISHYVAQTKTEEERSSAMYVESLVASQELSLSKEKTLMESYEGKYDIEKERLHSLIQQESDLEVKQKRLKKQNKKESAESEKLTALRNKQKQLEKEVKRYRELYKEDAITLAELESKEAELEAAKSEIKIQERLVEDGEYEEVEQESELETKIKQVKSDIRLQESEVKIANTNVQNQSLVVEQLEKESEAQLTGMIEECEKELRQQLSVVENVETELENSTIIAPCDGVVKTCNINTEGSVVTASELLAEIVPDESQILVEAEVTNQDIGYITIGQEVGIKFDTYDYQKYGKWIGTVTYISSDTTINETGVAIYKVNIAIDENSLGVSKELITGMTGNVEIKTGEKRLIEFFLKPLTEYLDSGLKVR